MIERSSLSAIIAKWTQEAVERWGDDWPRIWAYIETRMIALDPAEKRDLAAEVALTLVDAHDRVPH